MHSSYNNRKAKALSDRGKRMAEARWKADRARRDAEMLERIRELAEADAINMPRKRGDSLGSIQWTDFRSGKVRRWIVKIGDRSDRMTFHSTDGRSTASHGWTWFLNHIRGYLAGTKISPTKHQYATLRIP